MLEPAKKKRRVPRRLSDRYLLTRPVAQGGMASVYIATDEQTGRTVAIKVLHSHLADNREIQLRFQLEEQTATRVQHPNVVRCFGSGEYKGFRYLVLEYVDGRSLSMFLRAEMVMPADIALQVVRQAALGLAAIHEKGVVHRDIKPGNILLLGRGARPEGAKIADFGLVRVDNKGITQTGITVGTTSYMAPEQVLADPADARTDVYGLGVVLFVAITGEIPFAGRTATETMGHHLHSHAPPASWLATDLDPRIDAITAKMLRKDRDLRYQNMDEVVEDLERVIGRRSGDVMAMSSIGPVEDIYQPSTSAGRQIQVGLKRELEGCD